MTDIERRNELAKQIREMEAQLKPLKDEFRMLNHKINEEYTKTLPYHFQGGYYNTKKKGITALYWNHDDKTYYQKPLYKPSGVVYGIRMQKINITEMLDWLKMKGYSEKP